MKYYLNSNDLKNIGPIFHISHKDNYKYMSLMTEEFHNFSSIFKPSYFGT